jgi:Ca-activated chloride channel homolog
MKFELPNTIAIVLAGLLLFTLNPAQKGPPAQVQSTDSSLIVNSDLVNLTVTVTDVMGRYIKGLNKEAFSVYDNKELQQISFFSDEDAPLSIGFVFDTSGSMRGDKIPRSHFFNTSHKLDEYLLVGFNSRAELLADRTRDPGVILETLGSVKASGQTALYDGCYLAANKISSGSYKRRALLLLSDGQDNNSRYTLGDLKKLIKESDITVYSVGILDMREANSFLAISGREILYDLSELTGGQAFFPKNRTEMNDAFEQIALELRHQYSIAYQHSKNMEHGTR